MNMRPFKKIIKLSILPTLMFSSLMCVGVTMVGCKQPLPKFLDFGSIHITKNDFKDIAKFDFYAKDPAKPSKENLVSISRYDIVQNAVHDFLLAKIYDINKTDYSITNNATTNMSFLTYVQILFTVTATNEDVATGSFSFSVFVKASSNATKDIEVVQFKDDYRNIKAPATSDLNSINKQTLEASIRNDKNLIGHAYCGLLEIATVRTHVRT